jgi:hypothetical protein
VVIDLGRGDLLAEYEGRRRAGAAGVFPFGFAWQARLQGGQSAVELANEPLRIVPADVLHRIVGVFLKTARVDRPHSQPEGLCAGRVGEPETMAQPYFVQLFSVPTLGFVGRRTHQKLSRFDPAKDLARVTDAQHQRASERVFDEVSRQ